MIALQNLPNSAKCDANQSAATHGIGVSGHAKPSWQVLVGNPNDGGASCAGAPSTGAGAGGTSFASPIWVNVNSLVNTR